MTDIAYKTAEVDGLTVFYREAGAADAPTLLLLHGFPSSSHMFRDLIPLLADDFHLVAPDLPGFGKSDMPEPGTFDYTFDHLADVIDRFTEVLGLDRFAIYVFDYGAPVGFRIADQAPGPDHRDHQPERQRVHEGLSDGWGPVQAYWKDPSPANREAVRTMVQPETTIWQYTHGVPDVTRVSPDGYGLDNYYLARPGADEIQLDLMLDYASNIALYPAWQEYFRDQPAAAARGLGQQRPVLHPARRRSVQARHPQGRRPLRAHRPLRAGDPRRGDRERDHRLPRPLARLRRGRNGRPAGSGEMRGMAGRAA